MLRQSADRFNQIRGNRMAEFKVQSLEGTQYVEARLDSETIQAEAGAFCYLTGDIAIRSRFVPSFGGIISSLLAQESLYRPTYSGTGVITLESTLGGFYVMDLDDETWILEPGTYWASEESIKVSFHREKTLTSIWAGEGLVYLQTKVRGKGKVVVNTRGPIEHIQLQPGKKVVVEGKHVVCRTADVSFKIQRPTRNFLGIYTSGESWVRVYEGSGKLLLNPAPYWRYRMLTEQAGPVDQTVQDDI
jgi:uncharacterized protein (AIM24 family)